MNSKLTMLRSATILLAINAAGVTANEASSFWDKVTLDYNGVLKKEEFVTETVESRSFKRKSDSMSLEGTLGTGTERLGLGRSELQQLAVSTEVTAETTGLFGDQVDLSTGKFTVSQLDLNLPGNFDIPIQIRRNLLGPKQRYDGTREFDIWSLELPHISTTLVKGTLPDSGFEGAWGEGQACSGSLKPGSYLGGRRDLLQFEYWNGDNIQIPGKGGGALNSTDGSTRTTKNNWLISCITTSDKDYEGFVVTTNDGMKYTFHELKTIPGSVMSKPLLASGDDTPSFDLNGECLGHCEEFQLYNTFMMVSRIEDKFGNFVSYNYQDMETDEGTKRLLKSIISSDGRKVTFGYGGSTRIKTIAANDRTWTYNYNENLENVVRKYLTSIDLPNGQKWQFSGYHSFYDDEKLPSEKIEDERNANNYCMLEPLNSSFNITHPMGMKAEFRSQNTIHGRTEVPKIPLGQVLLSGAINTHAIQRCYSSLSLVSKTLTFPDDTQKKWTYAYSQNEGSFKPGDNTNSTETQKDAISGIDDRGLPAREVNDHDFELDDLKTTTIDMPDGRRTIHYFIRRFDWLENSKAFTDHIDTDKETLLSRTAYLYKKGSDYGSHVYNPGMINHEQRLSNAVLVEETTYQNGNEYRKKYQDFNEYEVATKLVEGNDINGSNTVIDSRFQKYGFVHDTTNWVLNLPTTVELAKTDSTASYKTISETTYKQFSSSGENKFQEQLLPYEQKHYGEVQKTFIEYHDDGNVKKVEFNTSLTSDKKTNRYQQFDEYHRGVVGKVTLPKSMANSSMSMSRTVDDNGWVTSTTDFNGNTIWYGYDDIGRLTYIDPVDKDVLDTLISWSYDGGDSNKQPVRTTQRCKLNAEKTGCSSNAVEGAADDVVEDVTLAITDTYDALLRPVLSLKDDGNQTIYVNRTYNMDNQVTFESFPSISDDELSGTDTSYDGIGRVKNRFHFGARLNRV